MMESLLICAAIVVLALLAWIISRIARVTFNNYLVKMRAERFGTPDLCCCGSMLGDHGWGDNHPFVSEMEYYIDCNTLEF